MAIPPRILKETQRLHQEPIQGIEITPSEKDFRHFFVTLSGPQDTAYEGGRFKAEVYLPPEYPMSPPTVLMRTKIYHPNFDKLGRICLDILKTKWSPALQIRSVLLSIQALMSAANLEDPLDQEIADHFSSDNEGAILRAREWTAKYAQ